jgi:8-oxo-dGTP diphosphatase
VTGPVLAAGGLVLRDGPSGPEVVLVHRPRYDDWTLPKGKLDEGEGSPEAALREVLEETGLDCRLGRELATTAYVDSHGRPKVVRYWSMSVARDRGFEPGDEVDEVRWLSIAEAGGLLTYDRDRDVLASWEDG